MVNLSTAFSILLFIIAIHFLLKGINYKKILYLCNNVVEKKEQFKKQHKPSQEHSEEHSKKSIEEEDFENKVECIPEKVFGSNHFANNENDSNFQSNVLNTTKFYQHNTPDNSTIQNTSENKQVAESPHRWNYKNEFVMNGGELMNGVRGINNDLDNYYNINKTENFGNCYPFTKSSILDDDIRMGLGQKL